MSIHDTSRVRYEFVGGPMDGAGITEEGGEPIRDGMVYEILVEGSYLYRSNGPMGLAEDAVVVEYVGKHVAPSGRPDVFVMPW